MIFLVSLLAVILGNKLCLQAIYWPEILGGWGIAILNHSLGTFLKRQSFKNTVPKRILTYAVLFNVLRLIALLVIVILILKNPAIKSTFFIFSFFVSYFIFLIYYVVVLGWPKTGKRARLKLI